MKKSILASSIAAAVFSLGATGVAQAANEGNLLVVPYYTAQDANSTLLSLVNTDTANGKAVKVRFRGAANSDDVYDFQVFLSPGDVWTANVSKGATGAAQLTTTDKSCTKPEAAVLNKTAFLTNRLDQKLTGDALANGTREGYVEIINMGDIPKIGNAAAGTLYHAVKHVKGVAPCSGAGWDALNDNVTTELRNPTGGLMANWTIINTVGAAAWSGEAVNVPFTGTTKITYFPQTDAQASDLGNITADPLFLSGTAVTVENATANTGTAAAVIAASYDFPDMSTPLVTGTTPVAWVSALTTSMATKSITNEFLTDSAIGATTDWVFSMPTRRYAVAMTYGDVAQRRFTVGNTGFFSTANTAVTNRQICVSGVSVSSWDREETTATTGVVISPSTPTTQLFCGEASVLSFNNGTMTTSGSLKASVAVKNIEVGYNAGWAKLTLAGSGLPVVGGAFVRALGNGTQTFGASYAHR